MLDLACSALSTTFLPTSAALYIMKQKKQTRLMSQNSGTMPLTSELKINHTTATNTGYEGLMYISPSKESLTTAHIEDPLEQAVKKIKRIMANKLNKPAHVEELIMIDAIQRLGLEFYFQDGIEAALYKHHNEANSSTDGVECLHDFALRFRLLRQQGYHVPGDIFSKFKDKDGKFKDEISKDIKGMMSLYEASHLRIPGEHILDVAGEFTDKVLRGLVHDEQSGAAVLIRSTLDHPCHKSLPRLMAKKFLQNFDAILKFVHDFSCRNSEWTIELQKLAKIDSYLAQTNHQNEAIQVSRWWKGLEFTEELKLARNQSEKWHMWSVACLSCQELTEERVELTKAISFVFIIDDIFDMYGTLEELTVFTEAVNKWECENLKGLPDYMATCLKKLYEATDEISVKTYKKYGWNPIEYLQTVWADLCNTFLVEAKWFASRYTPTTDEYMKNGRTSTGTGVVCAYLFMLLGEGDNNTRVDLLNLLPNMVHLGGTILRLLDDLGSNKDKYKDESGNDGSYITCYMNEHKGSTAEGAQKHVHTMISDEWKCINEAFLSSLFSPHFKAAFLNSTRMVALMYPTRS